MSFLFKCHDGVNFILLRENMGEGFEFLHKTLDGDKSRVAHNSGPDYYGPVK